VRIRVEVYRNGSDLAGSIMVETRTIDSLGQTGEIRPRDAVRIDMESEQ
jgi:hypothetical protein